MEKLPAYLDVKSGNYQFPSRDISEKEKDLPQYSLEYSMAIYNRYLNDKCGILYSTREDLDTIRLYGKGAQPISIYKSWYQERANDDSDTSVLSKTRSDSTRQGWENISTRVISAIPRIRKIVKGYIDQVGQDVFVDAVDPLSNDMQQNMKWKMFAVAQNFDFINEYHVKAGIPQEELEFLPTSMTELNLYESMGGFKMNYARAMEKLVRHTEKVSKLDNQLKDEWVNDAFDLGVMAGRVVYDRNLKKYRYRYINPKYFVIQFVKDDEYSKSEWAGYIEPYTISELKQIMPDKPEEFFIQLAYIHRGKHGNTGGRWNNSDWDNFSKHSGKSGTYDYDDYTVEVLEAEWVDYEAERNLVYSYHGHKTIRPLGKNSVVKLSKYQKAEGSKDLRTKMRRLRGAKWVIGTDITFDEGLVNMTDRPKDTDVMHSFRLYTLKDLPITEQLIPIADDMAIAWYRWQDDRAMLQRSGYAVDIGMMENIDSGGEDWNFLNVLKHWRETRYLLHQQSLSGRYEGGGITPVQPIESLVKIALEEFIITWEAALKRIEDVTGLNLVMLGATAPQGSQVTTTQMSAQSAIHVLKPIINTMGEMKVDLAETAVRRLQLAFKARDDIAKGYVDVVGEMDVELLKQAEKDAVQYGLSFEDKPSEEMRQNIVDAARAALDARRQGMAGIKISEYLYIVQQLESGGNIKELSALLDYLQIKSDQAIQENKERATQVQNEGLAKIEQQKAQSDAQMQQMKTQGDVVVEREKRQTELQKIRLERGEEPLNNNPQGGGIPRSPAQNPNVPASQETPA